MRLVKKYDMFISNGSDDMFTTVADPTVFLNPIIVSLPPKLKSILNPRANKVFAKNTSDKAKINFFITRSLLKIQLVWP
jgi:hypothetical protein